VSDIWVQFCLRQTKAYSPKTGSKKLHFSLPFTITGAKDDSCCVPVSCHCS